MSQHEEGDSITTAVMLGKIEVRLDQVLMGQEEHRRSFEETWTRLRSLEEEQAASRAWRATIDMERSRRPGWWSVVSTLVGVAGFLLAAGVIGARGI